MSSWLPPSILLGTGVLLVPIVVWSLFVSRRSGGSGSRLHSSGVTPPSRFATRLVTAPSGAGTRWLQTSNRFGTRRPIPSLTPRTGISRPLGFTLVVLVVLSTVLLGVAIPGVGAATPAGEMAGIDLVGPVQDDTGTNETVRIEGSPDLVVSIPDDRLDAGNETMLEVFVSNRAGLAGTDADPTDLRQRVSEANRTAVELSVPEETPIEVSSEGPDPGTIGPGQSDVPVTFLVTVADDASPGEYDLDVELSYVDVSAVTYRVEGNETVVVAEELQDDSTSQRMTVVVEAEERSLVGTVLWMVPPVVPAIVLALWVLGKREGRARHTLNRLSRVVFDPVVSENTARERRIEAAYIGTTYRTYAAKTLLFASLALVAGTIAGGYLVAGLLMIVEPTVRLLSGLPRTITQPLGIHPGFTFDIATRTRWLVILLGGLVIGGLSGVLSFVLRWQLPASDATVRRRGIEESLPRTTAFMYALSRGGMEFPQILRTLTDYREVYGETANEMSIAVREMDLFGRDMITALRRMSRRTPSNQFKTFSENLTSVLQSGSDLSAFFKQQYERFREEAADRQREMMEFLATIAEAYVTVFVAGMLFFITILLVFGLTVSDTLWLLQIIVYAIIPLANAGFALILQQQLDALGIGRQSETGILGRMSAVTPVAPPAPNGGQRVDGGRPAAFDLADAERRRTLWLSDRIKRLKRAIKSPIGVILWNPTKLLWITVPIALVVFFVRAPAAFQGDGVAIRVLDDLVIQSLLFVLGTYAIVRYFHKRHVRAIEQSTPEFLDRMASLNEAGMSVVQSLSRIRGSELGVLTPEVDRIWRDVEYGATMDDALIRFGRRVRTVAITRVVILLTNAMRASGNLGPVLRIASEQARAELRLRQQRRQQMLTYLLVIYVGFFVFLVIILAVNEVLVPSLPDTVPTPQTGDAQRLGANPEALARFGAVDQAAYTLIFFHAALIQAVCAGFIGGQLGEGSLRDGAKHAAIMLAIAYVAFILLASPIASISVETQEIQTDDGTIVYEVISDGDSLTEIEHVSLSEGGFVAVYDVQGVNGTLYGSSEYLPPGSHSDVVVHLDRPVPEDATLRLVVHRDTNGNERFDFETPFVPGAGQVDRPYDSPSEDGEPGIEVRVLTRDG